MRTLSLRPWWAWAVMFGGKTIENRTWSTDHRGPLAVHASASRAGLDEDREAVARLTGLDLPDEIDFGAVIGAVDLLAIFPASEFDRMSAPHARWCFRDNFLWAFADPRPCVPLDVKGKLRLWEFPAEQLRPMKRAA